jgi:hypothetical protein
MCWRRLLQTVFVKLTSGLLHIIIIIIIIIIYLMQGIYNYVPETNHVSRVENVGAIIIIIIIKEN